MKTRWPEMCFVISAAFLLCATPAAAQETVNADAAKADKAASGALGIHAYENVGTRFLSADPGADGSTPFAGARVGASYIFGRSQNHFELGWMGFYAGDLTRSTVTTYSLQEDWLDDTPRAMTSTHTLGTHRLGAVVTVGWTRDLL